MPQGTAAGAVVAEAEAEAEATVYQVVQVVLAVTAGQALSA